MRICSIKKPFLLRREPDFLIVFDPFPGGGVIFLTSAEGVFLEYALGAGIADITSRATSNEAFHRFLLKSRGFLSLPSEFLASLPPLAKNLKSAKAPAEALQLPALSGPVSIAFIITNTCNNSCPYCCVNTSNATVEDNWDIPSEYNLLELKELGVVGFHIHGGEPLLVAQLPEFVGKLSKIGFITSLSTRMILQTDDYWRKLASSGLQLLQFSCDLNNPNIAEFAQTVANATKAGNTTIINLVQTRDNVSRALADNSPLELLLASNANEIRFEPLQPSLKRDISHLAAKRTEVVELANRALALDSRIRVNTTIPAFPNSCEQYPLNLCAASDGFIYSCDKLAYYSTHRLANWKESGFKSAWKKRTRFTPACPFSTQKDNKAEEIHP